jgi:hypothetical protein
MNNPSQTNNYTSGKYFLIAFGLLNILAFTLLFCGLGFLAGLPVAKWQFPLACLVALVINYYAAKHFIGEKAKNHFIKNGCVIIGSVVGFMFLSGLFYDTSFDGQWYHQETIIKLKQGYNPVYQKLPVPANELHDGGNTCNIPGSNTGKQTPAAINLKYQSINNFSKGSEIIQATIYQLTNRIETAKAVNFMLLEAVFFLCLSFLHKLNAISNTKKLLLAVLLAFNPIVITQLLTFCVDGNLGCLLLGMIAIACLIFIQTNRYYLFMMISLVMLTVNIKYTGLAYAGIFGLGFILVLWRYKKMVTFKKVLIAGLVSFAIGIFCCGFNPYVTNLVQKNTLFVGIDETRAAELELTPTLLKDLNRVEKLFLSLSTHEGPFAADKTAVWHIPKIPFYFTKQDIHEAYDSEQMLSGFGPFFFGGLLIAGIILIIAGLRFRKTKAFSYAVIVFAIILITVLILPDAWWVRFVPQLWLLPIIVLCMAAYFTTRNMRILSNLLYISLGLSVAWASLNIFFNIVSTNRINYQLQQLRAIHKPINVKYSTCKGFRSNRVRFAEAGIPTIETDLSSQYIFNLKESNTRFENTGPLPGLPKPILYKISEGIFKKAFWEKEYYYEVN